MLLGIQPIRSLLKQNIPWKGARYCGSQKTQAVHGDKKQKRTDHGVRVRYAPSPTGHIHINGLRTALYSYLFAKANKGKMIVRVDDIDHTIAGHDVSQQQIFRHLAWSGIVPDESVVHGGDFGPYVQSQRLEIYHRSVKELLENGSAYYCFCTENRLESLREAADGEAKQKPKYDNRCRDLTPLEVAEMLASKRPMSIRFKLDADRFDGFDDIIQGHFNVDVSIDGDPVIIKSDGNPTYNFANVIDDHMMQITHVLRGAEWLPATPKQLSLYSAFGWKPPQYAHLPLILNADGTKMHRSHGHANVEYYREQRIFPLALVNYVASCGYGSQSHYEGQRPKIHTIPELIESFELRALSKDSSRFNAKHLDDYNRMELIRHIKDPELCENIVRITKELIQRAYPEHLKSLDLDDQHIRNVLHWSISTDHLQSLHQLVEGELSFLWILPMVHDENINSEWVHKLAEALGNNQFDKKHLIDLLQDFSKANNLKFSQLMVSLRHLLGGIKQGPNVIDMMKILGRTTTIKRLLRRK